MKTTPESLIWRCTTLSSLPTIYAALNREINNPASHLDDIATILSDDSALSARLLRITNSAMYNFPSKIDTISRAITIVGTNQLRDLAFSTSVLKQFNGIDQSLIDMEVFWRHNIGVGVAARVLATYHNEPNVERFYLMGLLHDVGRLVMFNQMPEQISELIGQCRREQKLLHIAEEERFGFDHGEVGMTLLRNWKLPEATCQAVGYHHHPLRSRAYLQETSVIHVADLLVNGIQLGSSNGIPMVPPLVEQAWDSIGLSPALLPDILAQIESLYHDVVELFLHD